MTTDEHSKSPDTPVEPLPAGAETQMRLMAVASMAAMLAHDLIQPLTAALNYIQLASMQLRRAGASEGATTVELAANQIGRALEIIHRTRGFLLEAKVVGRSESLRLMIDRVRGDLLVQDRLDAEVEVRIAPDANFVLVDRISIELVLTNLIANAAESMEDSPRRRIEISSRRRGRDVELCIGDSGPGIPEKVYPALWDTGFTTKAKGAGLGLPICKAIVEAHGGRIWADRSDTNGAAFHLTLPAASRA